MSDTLMGNQLGNLYEKYYELVHCHIKERLSNWSEEEIEGKTLEVFQRATRWLKSDGSIGSLEKRLIRIADDVCEAASLGPWLKNGESSKALSNGLSV